MILSGRAESGAEEWICPACGRRMLLRWPPDYEKLVLEHGDESAIHVGGKGGVRVGEFKVAPAPEGDMLSAEREWLRDNGIDWDGESALDILAGLRRPSRGVPAPAALLLARPGPQDDHSRARAGLPRPQVGMPPGAVPLRRC